MLKAPVIFLTIIFAFGNAWSSEPEKINTNTGNQTTKYEQRGTENSPIFVHGEVTTKKNEEEASEDAEDRKIKAETDAALVEYTGMLAIFTCLLFVFTAALWLVTFQLSRDARKTSDRQASEMKKSLDLAEKQTVLSGRQADLAEKQHELQRWQYITMHRPRLIIRGISLGEGDEDGSRSPNIQFNIVNIGGSRATIIESNATFARIDGSLPAIPPYSMDANTIKCPIREAGESDPPETMNIEDVEVSHIVSSWRGKTITNGDTSQFYFFGRIRFCDSIGIVRRMAFCRRYNPASKRFVEIDDPEYEYAD